MTQDEMLQIAKRHGTAMADAMRRACGDTSTSDRNLTEVRGDEYDAYVRRLVEIYGDTGE